MRKKNGFVAEFREFIMRGNVLDLAVGVIIGGAFQAIVKSLVDDVQKILSKKWFERQLLDVFQLN